MGCVGLLSVICLLLTIPAAAPEPERFADSLEVQDSTLSILIVDEALSHLGVPYVYGGTGPSGFDCSGLVFKVFGEHGIPLPRTAGAMASMGEAVSREDLQPGDLIIFQNPGHVGIYIGDGNFIHSSSYRNIGVTITPIDQSNYVRRYSTARRVIQPDDLTANE
jgi:cell wall-associated NlpC family hydrolase